MYVLFFKSNILKLVAQTQHATIASGGLLAIASYNMSTVATVKLLAFIFLVYSREVPKCYIYCS